MKRRFLAVALTVLVGLPGPAAANRLFTSGFELQSVTNGIEWYTSDTPPATGTISTAVFRSGAASLRVQNPASGVLTGVSLRHVSSGANGVTSTLRCYVRIATLPNAATGIMGFGSSTIADLAHVILNTDGTLSTRADADTVLAGSTVLATDTWYRVELRALRHASAPNAGADELELRIDGSVEAGATSTTQSISVNWSRTHVGLNVRSQTATTGDVYFDDCALNDSNGSNQTGFPGEGSVVILFPNGDGDSAITQTMTLSGDTPAATASESVDDGLATGTVDTTDHVTFTANTSSWTGSGSRLAVNLESMPTATSVALVSFGVRGANLETLGSSYILSAQVGDGGTRATDTSGKTLQHATEWHLNVNSTVRAVSPYTLYVDPGSNPWTASSINSLQMLIRGTDTSPNFFITSMWAHVEYTPGEEPEPGSCAGRLALLGVGC